MASVDCFLLTSLEEGTPTAILEAMAAGLRVVTSPAGGIGAIIQEPLNGYVVEGHGAEAYRARLRRLFALDLRSSISRNNREKALLYRWPVVSANVTSAMAAALKKPSRRQNEK